VDVPTVLREARADAAVQAETLARDLRELFDASASSNADDEHDPEGATIGFERAQLMALLERARRRVTDLDDALRRWDAGTYGRCERCEQPIPAERLAARPSARRCVACQSAR
jgi:RNA polymerase-binding protein DksA